MDNGGCQHNCVNTDGSYYCFCNNGYDVMNKTQCVGMYNIIFCNANVTSNAWQVIYMRYTASRTIIILALSYRLLML